VKIAYVILHTHTHTHTHIHTHTHTHTHTLQILIDTKTFVVLPEMLIYGNKSKLKSIMNLTNDEQLGMQNEIC